MSTSIPQVQNEVALTEITPENWEHYDTVYIGYPIRWGIAAWPVNQFVTGKAVIPLLSLCQFRTGSEATHCFLKRRAPARSWRAHVSPITLKKPICRAG